MEDDESDVIDGDGSTADDLNDTDVGASYAANQTPFDVADNGMVTQTSNTTGGGTTTTTAPASWLTSLTGALAPAGQVAGTIATLTGKTTAPAQKVAGTGTAASSSSTTWIIVAVLAALALGAFLIFGKKKG